MFSQNLDSAAGGTERKAGAMTASFILHVLGLGVLGVGIVFSEVVVVQRNSSVVATLTYTARPGDPEQVESRPNTLHIPRGEVVTLPTQSASRIPKTSLAQVEAPVLPAVVAPIAPIVAITYGQHGACGCVRRYLPDLPARKSQLTEAVLVKKVDPQYPLFARRTGVQGTVVVHAMIDRDGEVTDISVLSGPKELRQAAVEAIRQWRYHPYVLDGAPVEIETTITVNFDLRSYQGLSRIM